MFQLDFMIDLRWIDFKSRLLEG